MSDDDPQDREWVRHKKKPVSVERGINPDGLLEAAEEVLRHVQSALHEFNEHEIPLDMEVSGFELRWGRRTARDALVYLGGQRLAKEVEARAAPHGQPLAVCLGSAKDEPVLVFLHGRPQQMIMPGYVGCLRTFPDAPFGPGKRWPQLCPSCRKGQSNARAVARNELKRRAADVGRPRAA